MSTTEKIPTSVRLPLVVRDKLNEVAPRNGKLSGYITRAIVNQLKQDGHFVEWRIRDEKKTT